MPFEKRHQAAKNQAKNKNKMLINPLLTPYISIYAAEALLRKKTQDFKLSLIFLSTILKMHLLFNLCELTQVSGKLPDKPLRAIKSKCLHI
jgi:hypothetical protein